MPCMTWSERQLRQPYPFPHFLQSSHSTYPWFKIYKDGARYVSGVVTLQTCSQRKCSLPKCSSLSNLVKEHILPVSTLGSEVFKITILADTMLKAQLLPELTADCASISPTMPINRVAELTTVAALAGLYGDDFPGKASFSQNYPRA